MSEDEAINFLKNIVKQNGDLDTYTTVPFYKKEAKAIEKVLNELETYKHYYEELTTGQVQSAQLLKKYVSRDELEKKDKIIDAMAIQLAGISIWNDTKEEPIILMTEEEVKEYYERKVKDEKFNNR